MRAWTHGLPASPRIFSFERGTAIIIAYSGRSRHRHYHRRQPSGENKRASEVERERERRRETRRVRGGSKYTMASLARSTRSRWKGTTRARKTCPARARPIERARLRSGSLAPGKYGVCRRNAGRRGVLPRHAVPCRAVARRRGLHGEHVSPRFPRHGGPRRCVENAEPSGRENPSRRSRAVAAAVAVAATAVAAVNLGARRDVPRIRRPTAWRARELALLRSPPFTARRVEWRVTRRRTPIPRRDGTVVERFGEDRRCTVESNSAVRKRHSPRLASWSPWCRISRPRMPCHSPLPSRRRPRYFPWCSWWNRRSGVRVDNPNSSTSRLELNSVRYERAVTALAATTAVVATACTRNETTNAYPHTTSVSAEMPERASSGKDPRGCEGEGERAKERGKRASDMTEGVEESRTSQEWSVCRLWRE